MTTTPQHQLNVAYTTYLANPTPEGINSLLGAVTDYAIQLAEQYEELRTSDDASDIAQTVTIRVWSNIAKFKGRSSFRTWIHRIVRNAIYDRHRSQKRNISLEDAGDITAPVMPDSDIPASVSSDPICSLLLQGLTPKQIQLELSISKKKYYEDITILRENGTISRLRNV